MKKIIRLTESDLTNIIHKVVVESNKEEVTEIMTFTPHSLRLEARKLLYGLGIPQHDYVVDDTINMLKELVAKYGGSFIE